MVQPKPAEVTVVYPEEREFTDFEQFTGRIESTEVVEIRARVSGYLESVLFKDGSNVKEGDELFEIDPRQFEATVARSAAVVAQAEARFQRLGSQLERNRRLAETGAVTQDDLEVAQSDFAEAEANIQVLKATERLAELDLNFTKIRAPVGGWISRRMVDPGNLVVSDETPLAVIVALDPVYAYFDVDEPTVLRIRRLMREGVIKSVLDTEVTMQLSLADKEDYSLKGIIDYVENQIDANTGTLRVRAKLDNKDLQLSPGFFVRCRVPIGNPRRGLSVPEESLGADQGQRFLYVVNDEDQVVYRRVKTGPLVGGKRVIEDNLAASERVIVAGLQRVRPGAKVKPRLLETSSETAQASANAVPGAKPTPLN